MQYDTLNILYRDDHLVAINKPAGLLVHRSMIDRHETRFAMQMVRDQIGQHVYPVHRLDKPTSGVLVFALNPNIARQMTALFSAHQVTKHYLAIVRGFTVEQETIDYPLKEQLDKMTDGKADQHKASQSAITCYRRLATTELPCPVGRYATARYSLISITPKTGRKHQIRRHMKHIFHPIVGDTTHGDGKHNALFRERYNCYRLLLSAVELTFKHPMLNSVIHIHADPGPDFARIKKIFDSHITQ